MSGAYDCSCYPGCCWQWCSHYSWQHCCVWCHGVGSKRCRQATQLGLVIYGSYGRSLAGSHGSQERRVRPHSLSVTNYHLYRLLPMRPCSEATSGAMHVCLFRSQTPSSSYPCSYSPRRPPPIWNSHRSWTIDKVYRGRPPRAPPWPATETFSTLASRAGPQRKFAFCSCGR